MMLRRRPVQHAAPGAHLEVRHALELVSCSHPADHSRLVLRLRDCPAAPLHLDENLVALLIRAEEGV